VLNLVYPIFQVLSNFKGPFLLPTSFPFASFICSEVSQLDLIIVFSRDHSLTSFYSYGATSLRPAKLSNSTRK